MKVLAMAIPVFMFCACASAPWKPVQPASKVLRLNGFSIDLGNVDGWHINTRTGGDRIMLVKKNNASDPFENYAIEAYTVAAPIFKTDGEFLEAVRNGKSLAKNPDFKILRDETKFHKKQEENCALSRTVAEQHGKIPSFGFGNPRKPGTMIFEIISLACRETSNPKNILDLSFSLRYYPNERDPQFEENAMKIIDAVAIE